MVLTRWVSVAMAVGVVAVFVVPSLTTVWLWFGVVTVGVAIDIMLAASPRRVRVERDIAASVRRGEPTTSELLLTNLNQRPIRGVIRDAWQPSAGVVEADTTKRVSIPSGERRRVVTRLVPTRRGDRKCDHVAIRSLGPLRLAGRQAAIPATGTLRVLPPFTSRKHLPSRLARLREIEGLSAVQVRGQGTEFDSLRDYTVGDDVRSIDWRATARRQHVVVRTWRPERDRQVMIVLDTSRTSAARIGDEPRLDACMDAALLLAALATRAGDRVDLVAMDRIVKARVTKARGADLLARMVDAMAPLDPELVEADWVAIAAEVRHRLSQRALVVLLTPLDAAAAEEGLLTAVPALARRHTLVVASVTDPLIEEMATRRGSTESVIDAASAHRSLLDTSALAAALTRMGADVVSGDPETLPPRLADRYLALKASGRL